MSHKSLIKKTLSISSSTLLSRLFGFIRDLVLIRYLGAGAAADAWVTAFRLPNTLRKIFAEGALSAALIPTLVRVVKEQGRNAASSLMTRVFLGVEGFVLLLCLFVVWHAHAVICLVAPGFTAEQTALAVPLLRILIFYILFISSSAVLAGALQAVQQFFVPAFSQVVFNIVAIGAGLICWYGNLSVNALAWFFVFGGVMQFAMHLFAYMRQGFLFRARDLVTRQETREVFKKFVPCIISVGMIEVNLVIDGQFASYLPEGSIALLSYAANFMRIPLGVFIVAFSSILLPHLSRVGSYAPRRLSYYLYESSKLIFWVIIPIVLIMSFLSYDIFHTLYLSEKFSEVQVITAHWLLIIMLLGLFFFSINKILLNVFYALHETFLPTVITLVCVIINTILNYLLMGPWGVYGLAAATSIAGVAQVFMLLIMLQKKFKFVMYYRQFAQFVVRATAQVLAIFGCFYGLFTGVRLLVTQLDEPWRTFFLYKIGFWAWAGPLACCAGAVLLVTRRWCGIKLYFLDR
jgi:putative peptidoglycan lipid II flippase